MSNEVTMMHISVDYAELEKIAKGMFEAATATTHVMAHIPPAAAMVMARMMTPDNISPEQELEFVDGLIQFANLYWSKTSDTVH